MASLHVLRRLALREVHLLNELEEGYPYAVLAVYRLTVGRRRWLSYTFKRTNAVRTS